MPSNTNMKKSFAPESNTPSSFECNGALEEGKWMDTDTPPVYDVHEQVPCTVCGCVARPPEDFSKTPLGIIVFFTTYMMWFYLGFVLGVRFPESKIR
jgi:hypothetical protein